MRTQTIRQLYFNDIEITDDDLPYAAISKDIDDTIILFTKQNIFLVSVVNNSIELKVPS
jgi:hypothetical protein